MAKAVVDPEELLRFIAALKRFNETTKNELGNINRQFRRLGETWQDEEQARFAESFELMVRVVGRFVDESDRQAPLLTRKAEAIREYLRPR
ncbi:MAG: WXG100 family type VII secretion target [Planctomycetes bacterium]|nr:WXG100 family type VII secretion target [Planctomycetota bacterium]